MFIMTAHNSDKQISSFVKANFGMSIEVDAIIADQIPVGRALQSTVFLTKKKQLLCLIDGQSKLLLSDVQKIIARMGLKAELYMPPKGQPHYFDDIGRELFRDVFPGRSVSSEQDLIFYRTLAPYKPALVLVGEIKDGHIYQFDSDARSGWRVAAKFAYRRIKTS